MTERPGPAGYEPGLPYQPTADAGLHQPPTFAAPRPPQGDADLHQPVTYVVPRQPGSEPPPPPSGSDVVRHGPGVPGAAAAASVALLPIRANAYEGLPEDVGAALSRFRRSIPDNFDRAYVENAVVPFFLTSIYEGERPVLPMIDTILSKENALPFDLWGLIYKGWKPTPEEGVTVFLQGLEYRGDNNLRKKIYFSAVTPDLYRPMYQEKVVAFFDQLLDPRFAGKPFMRHYLDYYFDIYWDLHLGVKGDAIPAEVRQIGESFNTVLAFRNPMQQIVYENYMKVRALLDLLNFVGDRSLFVLDLHHGVRGLCRIVNDSGAKLRARDWRNRNIQNCCNEQCSLHDPPPSCLVLSSFGLEPIPYLPHFLVFVFAFLTECWRDLEKLL